VHQELLLIQPDTAYSCFNVALWSSRFQEGRSSFKDDPRSGETGRHLTATTKANIKRIEGASWGGSLYTIEAQASLSLFVIHGIPHDHLDMRKRKSRWIHHFISSEDKQRRLDFAKVMLKEFQSNRLRLNHIITDDECCLYHRMIK